MAALINRRTAIMGAVATATVTTLQPKASSASQPTIHDIKIHSFKFAPSVVHVQLGDVIRWTNDDLAPHTATADEFGWDTEALSKGGSAEITVFDGMEVSYFCVFHPHMRGSIKISEPSSN